MGAKIECSRCGLSFPEDEVSGWVGECASCYEVASQEAVESVARSTERAERRYAQELSHLLGGEAFLWEWLRKFREANDTRQAQALTAIIRAVQLRAAKLQNTPVRDLMLDDQMERLYKIWRTR